MTAKRAFDLILTVPVLILTAPLLLLIAAWVRADSPGPVLFRQIRVGRGGKHFRILKFRTMVVDAERMGLQLTLGRDPRITRAGAVLRKLKLDELPQLINVVQGEMSLVGPRPDVPYYVDMYSPEQQPVLDLMPGITSIASIKYRNESEILGASSCPEQTYTNEIVPEKIRINLEYARSANVLSDVGVILRTLGCMVRR